MAARRRYHRAMPAQTWVEPVVLEGSRVRMEPLSMAHFDDLAAVAFDLPIWQWTIMGPQDEAGLRRWMDTALANAEAGTERPFATIDLASGRAVGSSRYMSIVPEHKRLEIGWTWLATAAQRTGRQPRGQAAPADPRLRDAGRQPGRVQDPCPERALAHGDRGDRRDVRGHLPQPLDHARRLDPRLRLLQRHRPGMARREGRGSSPAWSADRRHEPGRGPHRARYPRRTPSSSPLPRRSHEEVHRRDHRDGDHVRDRVLPPAADRLRRQHPHPHRDLRSSPAW